MAMLYTIRIPDNSNQQTRARLLIPEITISVIQLDISLVIKEMKTQWMKLHI